MDNQYPNYNGSKCNSLVLLTKKALKYFKIFRGIIQVKLNVNFEINADPRIVTAMWYLKKAISIIRILYQVYWIYELLTSLFV